jgi:hypothetical protein
MHIINKTTLQKTWFKCSLTYIVTALLFGVIIYLLPGYQDPDPEVSYKLSFIQCTGIGFGFSFIIYSLFILILFLFSLFYKPPVRLFIKALICLTIVAIFFISFSGVSHQDKIQTLAIMILFLTVPYIEFIISKIPKSEIT